MGFINLTEKTINAKLVYYGVGIGGKTTSLKAVHGIMCPQNEVKLVSINTEQDSTLLFDFLPIDLGKIEGFKIRVRGFTVPGQAQYVVMRKYVLSGADAVVLVIDTQDGRIEENLQAIEDLKKNLKANGLDWEKIPLVIQYNKRDLPNALPEDKLDELFRFREVPTFLTVATDALGVFDAFTEAVGLMVTEKVSHYGLGKGRVEPTDVAVAARDKLRGFLTGETSLDPEFQSPSSHNLVDVTVGQQAIDDLRNKRVEAEDDDGQAEGTEDMPRPRLRLRGGKPKVGKGGEDEVRPEAKPVETGDGATEVVAEAEEPVVEPPQPEAREPRAEAQDPASEAAVDPAELEPIDEDLPWADEDEEPAAVGEAEEPDGSEEAGEDQGTADEPEPIEAGPAAGVVDDAPCAEPWHDEPAMVFQANPYSDPKAAIHPALFRFPEAGKAMHTLGDLLDVAVSGQLSEEASQLLEQAIASNMELANLYAQLADYKAFLEKKNRELVETNQLICHDLGKPLTVFKTVLGLLSKQVLGQLNPKQLDAVDNARESVSYMEELIGDLLEASRVDWDPEEFRFEEMDLTVLVGSMMRRLKYHLEDRGVRIRVEPLPIVQGDRKALTKVFMNLIGNAINYSDRDKETRRITVSSREDEEHWVVEIADNGIGIPKENLPTIFDKFKRGDNASGIVGTGLGLYLVKQYVMGHGGHVEVHSTPGEGTTFALHFPKLPVAVEHVPGA